MKLVDGADFHIIGDLKSRRYLGNRHDDLFEFNIRNGGCVADVERRQGPGKAVGTKGREEGLAPLLPKLAGLVTKRRVAHVYGTPGEGVQQFGISSVPLFGFIGKFIVFSRIMVHSRRRIVVIFRVVDIVIPGGAAEPDTELFVDEIQLREQVKPVHHQALVEIALRVVCVRIRQQILILVFNSCHGAVG